MTGYGTDRVGQAVRDFYEGMPFNYYSTAAIAAARLRVNPLPAALPDLHRLLSTHKVGSVIDCGCGAGWLANTLAYHYGTYVTGVDFSTKAIARARAVLRRLKTNHLTSFIIADLFDVDCTSMDLVTCMGVLHHTRSARKGFEHIRRFVAPRKYIYLGLYHRYGRTPFLRLFRDLVAREGEDAAFRRYAQLDHSRRHDGTHCRSWFRDQVLHPHESSHTLAEAAAWLADAGFRIERTSINGFRSFKRIDAVIAVERHYEELSRRANLIDGRYFPGFFTVLARRREGRLC
jgi:SAM-dependent methyltransferase